MRKNVIFSLLLLIIILIPACKNETSILTPELTQFIQDQYSNTLEVSDDLARIPRRIDEDGALVTTGIYGWTSG